MQPDPTNKCNLCKYAGAAAAGVRAVGWPFSLDGCLTACLSYRLAWPLGISQLAGYLTAEGMEIQVMKRAACSGQHSVNKKEEQHAPGGRQRFVQRGWLVSWLGQSRGARS